MINDIIVTVINVNNNSPSRWHLINTLTTPRFQIGQQHANLTHNKSGVLDIGYHTTNHKKVYHYNYMIYKIAVILTPHWYIYYLVVVYKKG